MPETANGLEEFSKLPIPLFWIRDSNPQGLLIELERTLTRFQMDRDFLDDEFRMVIQDLESAMNGFANPGISSVSDLKALDFSKLVHRPDGSLPRISLSLAVVDGSLSCKWHPYQRDLNGQQLDCEEWIDRTFRSSELFRPPNELLFVRNAHNVLMTTRESDVFTQWLCSYLISITHSTWNAILLFLRRTFAVQEIQNLSVVAGRAGQLGIVETDEVFVGENNVALRLTIEDALAKDRERVVLRFKEFINEHRVTVDEFYAIVRDCTEAGKTNFVSVANKLTLKGHRSYDEHLVKEIIADVRQAMRAGLWHPESNVVSLRHP